MAARCRLRAPITTLGELPLILPSRPHSLRLLIENALAERQRPINLRYQVDGLMIIKSMVVAGLGYTVLTCSSVAQEVEEGKLSATG